MREPEGAGGQVPPGRAGDTGRAAIFRPQSPVGSAAEVRAAVAEYLRDIAAETVECCYPALLGDPENGRWLLAPTVAATNTRRYLHDTLVLETTWKAEDGSIARVLDFMPPRGRAPDMVRIVEGVKGRVQFRSELAIRPGDPAASYHLGFSLLMDGHPDQAVTIFREVVRAKPDYEMAQFELGRALLQQGDAAGAIESLEAARKLYPDRDATYYQLSQAYRRGGRLPEAEQAMAAYKKLIESNRLKKRESLEAEKP